MNLRKLFGKDADKVVALCIDMYEQLMPFGTMVSMLD